MLIKLNVNLNERVAGEESFTPALVNVDAAFTIIPHTNSGGKAKIRFPDGHSILVRESVEYILAAYTGRLDTGYKAPTPKEA
jgi:hypothetical protein